MKTLSVFFILLISQLASQAVVAKMPAYPGIGEQFSFESTHSQVTIKAPVPGKVQLISFGFTHCPDICPLILKRYQQLNDQLVDQDVALPQLYFITVDPKRDTLERLENYIGQFDKQIIGLRPQADKLAAIEKSFAMSLQNVPNSKNIAHTDRAYLFDKKGQLRGLYSLSDDIDEIISAVKELN